MCVQKDPEDNIFTGSEKQEIQKNIFNLSCIIFMFYDKPLNFISILYQIINVLGYNDSIIDNRPIFAISYMFNELNNSWKWTGPYACSSVSVDTHTTSCGEYLWNYPVRFGPKVGKGYKSQAIKCTMIYPANDATFFCCFICTPWRCDWPQQEIM